MKTLVYAENKVTGGLEPVRAELEHTEKFLVITIDELVLRVKHKDIEQAREADDD